MDQHPVPQPITSYEFRLVGDMTIKQFGKLAAGIILALIVYGINPPGFIKWPLILLFTSIGFGMAFLPFEGRPIDAWIVAFFKRIYSPTLYTWQTKNKTPAPIPPPAAKTAPLKIAVTPPVQNPISPKAPTVPIAVPTQPSVSTYQRPVMPYIPKPSIQRQPVREKSIDAKFVTNMTIPAAPTMPNIIVGYLHMPDKKIIAGAIIEIRDSQDNPVRALKTNQLGQFQTATPLPGGVYEIEVEKEGLNFDIVKVNLDGRPLPPIEIISK